MLHKVNIAGLTMDPNSNTPIILLKAVDSENVVPIWIGLLEATSIASALQNIRFDRPMTHDLFKNFAEMMEIAVVRVEVCDLRDNTFFARIRFHDGEGEFDMDARPSDAIAIALRFGAPIFVDARVIEKAAAPAGPAEGEAGEPIDRSEEGRKWAEYLEKLRPEDFGKYKV